jgi:hypothetical protein
MRVRASRDSLHLFEQPRVLNRYYSLVCKGIYKLDLTLGERVHFGAPNEDHPNCLACVDQWDSERGARTQLQAAE